jgi:nucleoside-diphosphate-sugar epimerase
VPTLIEAGHSVTAVARSKAKADAVRAAGAAPVSLDLFDRAAVCAAIAEHDCVVHLATHIPTGVSAARRSAWRTNDSLRRKASAAIAAATIEAEVGRLIQESITFPYVDGADQWIDEHFERAYYWGTRSTVDAESAAASVTAAGGVGVVLRFAMFMAPDSAHIHSFVNAARRGLFAMIGAAEGFTSLVHIDDAATAVLAALDAPAGTYNVAELDPVRRSSHRDALAAAVGRRLRPVPQLVERAGGSVASSLSRSHRISSRHLCDVSPWVPTTHCVDKWKELA